MDDDLEALNFRYRKEELLDETELPPEIREQRRQAILKRRIMQAGMLLISLYVLYNVFFRSEKKEV